MFINHRTTDHNSNLNASNHYLDIADARHNRLWWPDVAARRPTGNESVAAVNAEEGAARGGDADDVADA